MLLEAALAFLNHVLAGEEWARDRLRPFAGETVRVELGALGFPLRITARGLLAAADGKAAAAVSISLPADAPMHLPFGRADLFSAAQVSGPADLAEPLGFVFRNLRWDAEGDIALLAGDILARRICQASRQLVSWQLAQAANLAANVADHFTAENPLLLGRPERSAFANGTADLEKALARVEQRIGTIEEHTVPSVQRPPQ